MQGIRSGCAVLLVSLAAAASVAGPAEASTVSLVWVDTNGNDLGETLDLRTYLDLFVYLDIRVIAEPATGGVSAAGVSLSYDPSMFAVGSVEVCPAGAPGNGSGFCAFPNAPGDLPLLPSLPGVLAPGFVYWVAAESVTGSGTGTGSSSPVEFTLGRIRFDIGDPSADSSVDGFYSALDAIESIGGSLQFPEITGAAVVGAGLPFEFGVDTTSDAADASPGDGVCATAAAACSLRAAIMEANSRPGRVHIALPAGTYLLTLPGNGEEAAATGDLDITDSVVLRGAGADCGSGTVITETTSSTEAAISVLGGAVEISDLCVTGSHLGITAVGGRLDLHDFALDANTYGFETAAGGNALLRRGSIAGNGGGSLGGGVYNQGLLHLDQVRVEDNSSTSIAGIGAGHGGIANAAGTLVLTNSSISGNTASSASAIHNLAMLVASNVSIFGNSALDSPVFWGTLYSSAAATSELTNVTIAGNSFGAVSLIGGARFRPRNTIVADAPGCSVALTSLGHNRERGTSCGLTATGDQQNVVIGFSQDTSGPTPTLVPTSGTGFVQNLGDAVLCPHLDQRLYARPPGGGCDIGAAELGSAVACANGLDDDGDGAIDLADPGCADASDPQELGLLEGEVLVTDSDGGTKRLDPVTGDVRNLSRGLGPRGVFAVTADARGIFVSDPGGALFEIDLQTGLPSLLTAGGQLLEPRGISLDANGRLLVADTSAHRIVRVDPATGAQTLVSSGPPTFPEHVIEDPADGTLLVSDYVDTTPQGIYRISSTTGAVIESCTGSPFGDPRQMVLSADGDTLWVVDSGPNRLFRIDLTAPLAGCSPVQVGAGMGDAWGVGILADGDIIVANRNEGGFWRVDPDTGAQTVISESPDIARPHEIVALPEPGQGLLLASGLLFLLGVGRSRVRG